MTEISTYKSFWLMTYDEKWRFIFNHVLNGYGCRAIALALLFLSIWYAFQRRNIRASILFFILMIIITFGFPVFHWIGLV